MVCAGSLCQACAPSGRAAVGGSLTEEARLAGGVRVRTMRIGAPQHAQRSVARWSDGGAGGGALNTSSLSSVASWP